jgi:hypothetical protein
MSGAYKYKPQYTQNTLGPEPGPAIPAYPGQSEPSREALAQRVTEQIQLWIQATGNIPVLLNLASQNHISRAIQAAIDEARAEEREACARFIQENLHYTGKDWEYVREQFAAAIRARGEVKP